MDLTSTFQQLGVALGLGLLVGLQRERTESRLAGIRTFPLITILGTICALLSQRFGGWIVAAGLIALAGMILAGKMVEIKEGPPDPGLTSEIAMLLMFGVGAYVVIGNKEVAIVVGGGAAGRNTLRVPRPRGLWQGTGALLHRVGLGRSATTASGSYGRNPAEEGIPFVLEEPFSDARRLSCGQPADSSSGRQNEPNGGSPGVWNNRFDKRLNFWLISSSASRAVFAAPPLLLAKPTGND